ncbi:lariat debranching enzyme, C-terminal domain-containing protein [Lipomyces chichibuensis]|uniref:lariat debranching enzyme, C-terminal domain-containing protein n=1 Tax=Lipomyces chichibuensis TaxID=1546026 RepID=UPI0033437E58
MFSGPTLKSMVNIAFEGCCHGELDKIYKSLQKLSVPIDLLIIGGDFQAARNWRDLNCMAVPAKYHRLGDFHAYYSGKTVAPILTLFIGGNHEASNYLWELYYGGWVAPNIYYVGAGNILNFGGVRIGGLSGIWKEGDYYKGHFERVPYTEGTKRSIYHVRQYDVLKLYQVSEQVEIMVSHDWPAGVEHFGRLNELLTKKKFLKSDIDNKALGSPPAMSLLGRIRPRCWLSAHLHVKYAAIVKHKQTGESTIVRTGQANPMTECVRQISTTIMPKEGSAENARGVRIGIDDVMPTTADGAVPNTYANEDEIEIDIFSGEEASRCPSTDDKSLVEESDGDQHNLAIEVPGQVLTTSLVRQIEALPEERANAISDLTTSARLVPIEDEAATRHTEITKRDSGFTETRFLALDKCLPRREFLQVIQVPTQERIGTAHQLCYDPEWLAITKATEPYMSLDERQPKLFATATEQEVLEESIRKAREWVQKNIVEVGKLEIPSNFVHTAPFSQSDDSSMRTAKFQPIEYNNAQTQDFCDLLGIPNRIWRGHGQ